MRPDNHVIWRGEMVLVDPDTMTELGLRQGQRVDTPTFGLILHHHHAMCVAQVAIEKAREAVKRGRIPQGPQWESPPNN